MQPISDMRRYYNLLSRTHCSCCAVRVGRQFTHMGQSVAVIAGRESRKLEPRREALLLSRAELVRRIAYHLFRRRNYVDIDDLIQAGMGGLTGGHRWLRVRCR